MTTEINRLQVQSDRRARIKNAAKRMIWVTFQ